MPRTVCDWLQASYCTNMRPFTSLFKGTRTHKGCNFLMIYRTFVYGVQVQNTCLHLLVTRELCSFAIRTSSTRNCIALVSLRGNRNVAFIAFVSGKCCASSEYEHHSITIDPFLIGFSLSGRGQCATSMLRSSKIYSESEDSSQLRA
jgi:hypothetical protein